MSNWIEKRSFAIEELIRTTEEMFQMLTNGGEDELENAVRKRGKLFEELTDLSSYPISAQQQTQWLKQLQYLQQKDEDLRSLLLLQMKTVRHELSGSHDQKKEILGGFSKGQTIEKSA